MKAFISIAYVFLFTGSLCSKAQDPIEINNCSTNLLISPTTPFQNEYYSSGTLSTVGSVVIQPNQQVTYRAEKIRLNEGFGVSSTAEFKATHYRCHTLTYPLTFSSLPLSCRPDVAYGIRVYDGESQKNIDYVVNEAYPAVQTPISINWSIMDSNGNNITSTVSNIQTAFDLNIIYDVIVNALFSDGTSIDFSFCIERIPSVFPNDNNVALCPGNSAQITEVCLQIIPKNNAAELNSSINISNKLNSYAEAIIFPSPL